MNSSDLSNEVWTGPAIAALLTAAIGAVVAALGTVVDLLNSWRDRKQKTKEHKLSRRMQQLNELYGPLHAIRATTRQLRDSLPPHAPSEAGGGWALVRNLEEAFASPEMRPVVTEIIRQNELAVSLIRDKAGLIDGTFPTSFERFFQHQALLKLCWDNGGKSVGTGGVHVSDKPFPYEIDDDIAHAKERVEDDLALLGSS